MKRERTDDDTKRFIVAKLVEAGFGDLYAEYLAEQAVIATPRQGGNALIADMSEPERRS